MNLENVVASKMWVLKDLTTVGVWSFDLHPRNKICEMFSFGETQCHKYVSIGEFGYPTRERKLVKLAVDPELGNHK